MSDADALDGCPVHGSNSGDDGETLSYGSYLRVPELISLQTRRSDPPAHDELLFITIHQAYELWFKEIIFELEAIRDRIDEGDIYEACRLIDRVAAIDDLLVEQIHILETMRPRDFLAFRAALEPASGFQSIQFREVEFLTGIQRPDVLDYVELSDDQRDRLERRLEERNLRDAFYDLLGREGFDVASPPPDAASSGTTTRRTVRTLGDIYGDPRSHRDLYRLAEALVDHDQKLQMWRYHHVRVVERLIGTKGGTGGSPGVEYLESTLDQRAFPLLWSARGELSDEEYYGDDPLADIP